MKNALEKIDDFRISAGERLAAARILAAGVAPSIPGTQASCRHGTAPGPLVAQVARAAVPRFSRRSPGPTAALSNTLKYPKAVCEIDLHCHSFHSDGYSSPSHVVFDAFRRGMKAVAIADHDVFDGQKEAIGAGKIFGVDVVPAIEFYTDRPGIEIIGHFPDADAFLAMLDSGACDKVIEKIRSAKKIQLEGMVERVPHCFAKFAFDAEITTADIDRHVRNGISTKGDISVIMWQKYGRELRRRGLASDVKDFQAKYTTRRDMLDLPLEIDIDISPEAFIGRILGWGGLPGLSHPTELRNKEKLDNCEIRKEIFRLADTGLQTVEIDGWRNATCPESGIHQTRLFDDMRLEYNLSHPGRPPLLFTNGSDNHDQPGEGLELGCGRNRNLNPDFGRYANVALLRKRLEQLRADRIV